MEITLETVVFYFLAAFITVFSILTVTTHRMVRSATYLLFVLFGTAGIYFLQGYTFLGSVQIMVYAGGIVVLYVFSILLTSGEGDVIEKLKRSRFLAGLGATVGGAIIVVFITLKHKFIATTDVEPLEVNIKTIGHHMLSGDKYGYLLPFEAVSILLLACIGYHVLRRHLWVLHPPQHTGNTYQHRADSECHGHQLCGVQPFPIPRRTGRIFLLFILHRHLGGRNGCSHCHHD